MQLPLKGRLLNSRKKESQYFYFFLCPVPSRDATKLLAEVGHDCDFPGWHAVSNKPMVADSNSIDPPVGT